MVYYSPHKPPGGIKARIHLLLTLKFTFPVSIRLSGGWRQRNPSECGGGAVQRRLLPSSSSPSLPISSLFPLPPNLLPPSLFPVHGRWWQRHGARPINNFPFMHFLIFCHKHVVFALVHMILYVVSIGVAIY